MFFQAVALGAAIQAGILDGQITDLFVMDVWQASLMRAFAQKQQQGWLVGGVLVVAYIPP
jgi:molecular chaperone DnaK (HSP70)